MSVDTITHESAMTFCPTKVQLTNYEFFLLVQVKVLGNPVLVYSDRRTRTSVEVNAG